MNPLVINVTKALANNRDNATTLNHINSLAAHMQGQHDGRLSAIVGRGWRALTKAYPQSIEQFKKGSKAAEKQLLPLLMKLILPRVERFVKSLPS
jgi:hypothetical protein